MSEPEIARRCPTCGASIREVALFCPQCGNAQPQPRAAAAAPETTSKNTAPLEGTEGEERQKSLSDTIAIERSEETPRTPATPGVLGAVGAKLQRATTLARDVEGDVIQRAQKVREISSVVLDEAGHDPGLRFLLVAGIVFVLFLVIVLLNRFIV